MTVANFPDIIRTAAFGRSIVQTKESLSRAATELVTGTKENLAHALGGRTGEYNLVTKALADIETDRSRNILVGNRLEQTGLILGNISTIVEDIAALAQSALLNNGQFGLIEVQETARDEVDNVLAKLNSVYAGRALFAGDDVHDAAVLDGATLLTELETAIGGATDEATIDAAITAYFGAGGGFETSIYQGGAGQASAVQLASGSTIQFDVKADNQAIRDTLEGLARVIFTPDDISIAWTDSVAAKLGDGFNKLTSLRSDIGRKEQLIEEAIDLREQEKLILSETRSTLDGVDPYEAASRVQSLEAQLEAAYTVASRLSQLSFTSYL